MALVNVCFCGGNEEGWDFYQAHWGLECIGDPGRYFLGKRDSHSTIFNLMAFQTQRQHERFGPLAFPHCSCRHTVFPNPLANNISWLFRETAFPCAYLCVDLWGIRNDRAELLGQLFKGKWEFVFFSHSALLSPTYIQQHKFSAFYLPRKMST